MGGGNRLTCGLGGDWTPSVLCEGEAQEMMKLFVRVRGSCLWAIWLFTKLIERRRKCTHMYVIIERHFLVHVHVHESSRLSLIWMEL